MERFFRIMVVFLLSISILPSAQGGNDRRWEIGDGNSIIMDVASQKLPHKDHVEMSGKKVAVVLYWSLDTAGRFEVEKGLVFPMLRTVPNNTHASLMLRNSVDLPSQLRIDNKKIAFHADSLRFDGMMDVWSSSKSTDRRGKTTGVTLTVRIFPSMEREAVWELYTAKNTGDKEYSFQIPSVSHKYTTLPEKGVKGSYVIDTHTVGDGVYLLAPGDSVRFALEITAYPVNTPLAAGDADNDLAERERFIDAIDSSLVLDTPDHIINAAFRNAKIRASESICKTKGGYMHAPGGESYYAAIWANDQAEYVNPFFPFTGYYVGNESALNSFRHFARYMNDEYKPIPSSIIAEGDDYWNGAGDRGDAAMIAYGAGRFALARGDKAIARELWPLIEWCLEFCRRNLNEYGVVRSDSDELEGRFPAGEANLCTSSLYYDALLSASMLGREIGVSDKQTDRYADRAKEMRKSIERYFGADMQGYRTYRYYDGNDILRSWICIPLTVGISDRADGTVKALFDSDLHTEDGLLTAQGDATFWDRTTLYALRGGFAAGYSDRLLPVLHEYSSRRLLGDHVPYPIEAWPEGSQRHLSAESGLYCRIVTEGIFGIRPTGLRSFSICPQLPSSWDHASLSNVGAFGGDFDIKVSRKGEDRLEVRIIGRNGKVRSYNIRQGETVKIRM